MEMGYSAAAGKTEYSDASVDDILAEYQYEQHSAAVQARYEALMQEDIEEQEPEIPVDDEGVKVYTPKKAVFPAGSTEDASEGAYGNYCGQPDDAAFFEQQNENAYYENKIETAYYEQQDESVFYDDSAYPQEAEAEYCDEQSEAAYSEQEYEPDYYDLQEQPEYYEQQDDTAYYDSQGQPEYYEQQDESAYYDAQEQPEYYEQQDESAYYDAQEQPEYYEQQDETPYREEQDAAYYADDNEVLNESAEELDYSSAFLTAEDFSRGDEADIDPRFNLGGQRKNIISYNGRELDLSPEENYVPPVSPYTIPVTEHPEQPLPEAENIAGTEDEGEDGRKSRWGLRHRKNKKNKNEAAAAAPSENEAAASDNPESEDSDYSEQLIDDYGAYGDYADADDYIPEKKRPDKEEDAFPSFGQYVLEMLTGLLYRLRAPSAEEGYTMEDSDEDLGRELSPMKASKYYGKYVHSFRLRLRISGVILLLMAYISLGLPLPGMLKTLPVQAAMCLACQLVIMLLSLDIVTGAALNMVSGRFGADCMAVLLCILTSIDALSVAVGAFGDPHTPFCLLSSLSLSGVLFSSLLSARGLRKALRVPAIGTTVYSVTGQSGVKGSGMTLLKSALSCRGFVRRTEESAPDETMFAKLSPILLAVCLLLALIVAAVKKSWSNYLFIATALLAPAVPVTALICFALPFFVGSMRIFRSGASIAGWSGLCDIGASKNLIVTDRDLFPQGSVQIEKILMLDGLPADKIISYAGAMMSASDAGSASCFIKLMEKNGCKMKHVESFEPMAGGGVKGIIDGRTVLCGSLELMRLMNVHVPYRKINKTPVLLAVDGVLYGIFNMKYTAGPTVRKALIGLIRSNRHPIFAVRDFNITPEMLHEQFDVATDGYDFPPYVERYGISQATPGKDSKISAVVCREGLGPLTHMADTGRSMYVATRVNLLLSIASAVIGILAVFIKFMSAGAASAGFLLFYMLLWLIPIAGMSFVLKF